MYRDSSSDVPRRSRRRSPSRSPPRRSNRERKRKRSSSSRGSRSRSRGRTYRGRGDDGIEGGWHIGTIQRCQEKFAFVEQDSREEDLFVMVGDCKSFGRIPKPGTRVKYTIGTNPKNGKPKAANVQPLEEEDIKPKRPPLRPPELFEIELAAHNIKDKAMRTPLVRFNWQCLLPGVEVYLKLENMQPLGSFKVRPAVNAIASIKDKDELKSAGACTASEGNFGLALAWVCKDLGINCTVVTPSHVPASKISEIQRYGAMVYQVSYSDWWEILESHKCPQAPKGSVFIHPGAGQSILAANATIALEICQDLPDVDCIIAPYGTGAVCTGIACGVRAMGEPFKSCRVLAAEPASASPFALSKLCGEARGFPDWQPSFVDGCGGKAVLKEVFHVAKDSVDGSCSVSLDAVAEAIKVLLEKNKVLAEGAGACSVAAAMSGMCGSAKKVVCVVCGGSLDTDKLVHILSGRGAPPTKKSRDDDHAIVRYDASDDD